MLSLLFKATFRCIENVKRFLPQDLHKLKAHDKICKYVLFLFLIEDIRK